MRRLCFLALQHEANRLAKLAAGNQHSLFTGRDGSVSTCGSESRDLAGLLGHGEGVTRLATPSPLPPLPQGMSAAGVVAGSYHSLLLADGGGLWSWGTGQHGQLGHGARLSERRPRRVEALAGRSVVAAAAGLSHSVAVTADGAIFSWGGGKFGQLGHGDEAPGRESEGRERAERSTR